jgi:hypothetical protein
MGHRTKTFWTAIAAAGGMIATAFWSAITTVGWPPVIPEEPPWRTLLFGVLAFVSFFTLLKENLGLTSPSLAIVYRPDKSPYVFDKIGVDGKTLRIHRVSVSNTGASASGVSVKLVKCDPSDVGAVYPGHELWPTGHPHNTLSVTVHRSGDDPLMFFDVIGQLFLPGNASERLHLRYAAEGLYGRGLSHSAYKITLAVHGPGAPPEPIEFSVEKDADGKQWVLRRLPRSSRLRERLERYGFPLD